MAPIPLAELRHRRLLSVRRLAAAAGVAPATIYHIEHGRTVPSFRAIRVISAALDTDPLDILEFAAVIEGTGAGKDRRDIEHADDENNSVRSLIERSRNVRSE